MSKRRRARGRSRGIPISTLILSVLLLASVLMFVMPTVFGSLFGKNIASILQGMTDIASGEVNPTAEPYVTPTPEPTMSDEEYDDLSQMSSEYADPATPSPAPTQPGASAPVGETPSPSAQPASSPAPSGDVSASIDELGTPGANDDIGAQVLSSARMTAMVTLEDGTTKQLPVSPSAIDALYAPFTVLDLSRNKTQVLYKKAGGKGGESGKIYGDTVGVTVVSQEGDWSFIRANRYPGGRPISGYVRSSQLKTITPNEKYAILVDKYEQKLYFFVDGKLRDEMLCSTGTVLTETPAGEFVTSDLKKRITADSTPEIAYDGVRINGRVYIHSIPHIDGNYQKGADMLGKKASHGCIRVPRDNASWFYKNLPEGTKVTILEYRGETPPPAPRDPGAADLSFGRE